MRMIKGLELVSGQKEVTCLCYLCLLTMQEGLGLGLGLG
jgi:hypothetical protein